MGDLKKRALKEKKVEFKPIDKSNLCVFIRRKELLR